MTDIYVVTEGAYSDYHIVGIYENRELAQMLVDVSGSERTEIEVFLLNPGTKELHDGLGVFHVNMEANGDEATAQRCDSVEEYYRTARRHPEGNVYAQCWARDEKHAIKIINEKRLMALASPEKP